MNINHRKGMSKDQRTENDGNKSDIETEGDEQTFQLGTRDEGTVGEPNAQS